MTDQNPYLTLDELANELGVDRGDVDAIIERHELPVLRRPNKADVVSRAALDAYMRRQRGEAARIVQLPPLSYEECLAEFLEATGGETPQEFYARWAAGEVEDTGENMTLLVKAVALGGSDT